MDWVAVATVAAGFSNTALLIVVIWQVHALARQTRASVDTLRGVAHANTFMSAIEIDRFFADRPDLRARFYGDLDGVGDQAELHRTDAAAEMLLDQFMMASTLVGHMSPDLRQGWKRYITHVVMRSPALQSFWQRNQEWYTLIELDEIVKPAGEFKAPAAVADPS